MVILKSKLQISIRNTIFILESKIMPISGYIAYIKYEIYFIVARDFEEHIFVLQLIT